mmetsp:Transcript_23919/g.43900  ORF Transcript_23919/g.43900 Transcript_23919/m.43900 type:complete len:344 (+) Transcript_23919:123-1154(+)
MALCVACFEGLGLLTSRKQKQHQRIGKYRLGPIIGKGAFADVRFATHDSTGERVAVKVITHRRSCQEDVQAEIANHRSLDHRHIVKVLDVVSSGQSTNLVMEYAPARLNSLFNSSSDRKGLPENEVRRIFKQVLEAVAFCHDKGIAHRDIKPDNILLDNHGDVKLTDFGLSASVSLGEKLTRACGSPSYIAPEILTQSSYDGLKADSWSCGVLLYILLTGERPFQGKTPQETLHLVKAGKYPLPSASLEAMNLLRSLMSLDPAQRWSINDALQHPWLLGTHCGVAQVDVDTSMPSATCAPHKDLPSRESTLCSTELNFIHAPPSCCTSRSYNSMESFGSIESL